MGVQVLNPGHGASAAFHDFPFAFLYLSNLFPMYGILSITWSLSVEEQFYLVIPAMEKYLRRGLIIWLLVFAGVLSVLPALGFFPTLKMPAFFRQTTFCPIILGVLLAHALHSSRGWLLLYRMLSPRGSQYIIILLLGFLVSYPKVDISGLPRFSIQVAFMGLIGICVIQETHVLRQVLLAFPMRRIGKVSYGIYLYHLFFFALSTAMLNRLGITSKPLLFVSVLSMSWLAAEISYQTMETRFLGFARKFRRLSTSDAFPTRNSMSAGAETAPGLPRR